MTNYYRLGLEATPAGPDRARERSRRGFVGAGEESFHAQNVADFKQMLSRLKSDAIGLDGYKASWEHLEKQYKDRSKEGDRDGARAVVEVQSKLLVTMRDDYFPKGSTKVKDEFASTTEKTRKAAISADEKVKEKIDEVKDSLDSLGTGAKVAIGAGIGVGVLLLLSRARGR